MALAPAEYERTEDLASSAILSRPRQVLWQCGSFMACCSPTDYCDGHCFLADRPLVCPRAGVPGAGGCRLHRRRKRHTA
jgi:hypothetical protein